MIVYRHRRLDKNEVFYIGIGSRRKRAYEKYGRNNLWQKITNKTEYDVEIIAENLSSDDAKELEMFLISIYGRIDVNTGTLANLTSGGEGSNNMSEESRKRISEAIRFRNLTTKQTPEQIAKRSAKMRGRKLKEEQIEKTKQTQYKKGLTKPTTVYYFSTNEKIGDFKSLGDACRFLGLNPSKNSSKAGLVARKIKRQYKGYIFEFINEKHEEPIKEEKEKKQLKNIKN